MHNKLIRRLIVDFDEERNGYVWKFSLSSNKISCISPHSYTDKCQAKRNGLRFIERMNGNVRLVDRETGEVLKFNPSEIEIEDLVGDLRRFNKKQHLQSEVDCA